MFGCNLSWVSQRFISVGSYLGLGQHCSMKPNSYLGTIEKHRFKILLNGFSMNGHTSEVCPSNQNLENTVWVWGVSQCSNE